MNNERKKDFSYWYAKREQQKDVIWYSTSRNSKVAVKIADMGDDHLLNTIKKVYDCAKRAEDLAFIEELQKYEAVRYTEWLKLLCVEYQYRKCAKEKELEAQIEYFNSVRDYMQDLKF